MLSRMTQGTRRCARCKQEEPYARFGSLSVRLCIVCRAADREASAARVAAARDVANALLAKIPAAKVKTGTNAAHLAWVRSLPCSCWRGARCEGIMHAHHVRVNTGGGMGMKPPDHWTVPLCAKHHAELHAGGHQTFERQHAVDLRAAAERLAARSPHLPSPTAT